MLELGSHEQVIAGILCPIDAGNILLTLLLNKASEMGLWPITINFVNVWIILHSL